MADPGNNQVVLQGGSDPTEPSPQYTGVAQILNAGTVAGTATIPPFTGCVTPAGDNLGPLLDATVSGPGNYIKMTTGVPCTDLSPGACTNGEFPLAGGRVLPPSQSLPKLFR
ncbi:MAG: hypothetical protein LBI49_07965, partial [Nocardiopsaceae bacterium]|jgi:hypothetical protein|nr:hypothetical protein [Nocardiopsaceae bacterium]